MVLLTLYIIPLLILAKDNTTRIKKSKRIYHGLNGALHLFVAAGAYFLFGWTGAILILLLTRVVFDVALNLMRGLPIDYVSKSPKSIVDKIEKWVFNGNGMIPKMLYAFLIIIILTTN
jgi:hypothetical protein